MSDKCLLERTADFWQWFEANEAELSRLVDGPLTGEGGQALIGLAAQGIALIGDGLSFNIGGDHELSFTASGQAELFLLLPFVTAGLPERYRGKWTVNPSMPGRDAGWLGISVDGVTTTSENVLVAAVPSLGGRSADLSFYSPAFEQATDELACEAFCALLEMVVGEALAFACVASVRRAARPRPGMFALSSLRAWLLAELCPNGQPPDLAASPTVYQRKPVNLEARWDIYAGSSCHTPLLDGYYGSDDSSYRSFTRLGAKPVFLYYYHSGHDRVAAERDELAERLAAEVLGERGSGSELGIVIGSAVGQRRAYIDLVLYDELAFIEGLKALLADFPYMVYYNEFVSGGLSVFMSDDSLTGLEGRLDQLHDIEAHAEIIQILEALPGEKLDFNLNSLLARALNSSAQEERALEVLELIRTEGEGNPLWNWRAAYALCALERYDEAIPYLERAVELGDDGEDVAEMLRYAREQVEGDGEEGEGGGVA